MLILGEELRDLKLDLGVDGPSDEISRPMSLATKLGVLGVIH